MSARRHRRHSTELKLRLVQSYLDGEGSFKAIAKQNDISHALLMIWVDKFRRGQLTEEIDYAEKALNEAAARREELETAIADLTDDQASQEGIIGLQVHGVKNFTVPYEIAWKNIRIIELGEENLSLAK